ncbi:MAG TPA: cytochrome c3 family protein [Candidatus Solibacter sp.]|nr:cytochrome c3 family protein [Candidatus Solibacter sp.]
MAQIFNRSANTLARASILGIVLLLTAVGAALMQLQRSPYVTNQRIAPDQPVPFSHQHHVAGLGLDCRYCHTSVEESSFAGIPPTKTCMNCHAQIWTNAALLEPVRASFRTGQSLQWTRVHDLPDFVYFNHSIHVSKGVGCFSCHGPVDQMPLMYQENSLQMEWCLNCHREPEKFLRPKERVFDMTYQAPDGSEKNAVKWNGNGYLTQAELGTALAKEYHLRTPRDITSCSTCHR